MIRALDAFLTPGRLVAYARLFAFGFVAMAVLLLSTSRDLLDARGTPVGADFVTFWAASDLSLKGHAGDSFDAGAIAAAERRAVPASDQIYLWHYPPVFLLYVLPLATVPYIWGYLAWVTLWVVAFAATMRRLAGSDAMWLALGSTATLVNVMHGQNGLPSAILVAATLFLLPKRPLLAGIALGLLCYKPHLGATFGLLLLIGGHWRAIVGAAIGVGGSILASLAAFGATPWTAFVANLSVAARVLEQGGVPWEKMPSVFVAARLLGAGVTQAYAVHGLVALGALAVALAIWRGAATHERRAAVAVAAAALVPPYLFDYDLAIATVAIAFLWRDGERGGWAPGVRPVVALAMIAPAVLPALVVVTGIQWLALVQVALLAATLLQWRHGADATADGKAHAT